MPEQFSLHERRCQRRAVHDDEGLVAAATLSVHGAGDEFFSGTGLASHQHRGVGRGNLVDLIEQPHDCGRPADDVLDVGPVSFVAMAIRFVSEARFQPCDFFQRMLEGLFDVQPAGYAAAEAAARAASMPQSGSWSVRQAAVGMTRQMETRKMTST